MQAIANLSFTYGMRGRILAPMSEPKFAAWAARTRDSFDRQAFMATLGARLTRVEPGLVEIEAAYRPDLTQQHGFFHGGVVGALADNAGGYAAFTLLPEGWSILTAEFKVNLVAPAVGDVLRARSKVLKSGRTLTLCLSEVFAVVEGAEKLCAVATVTLMGLPGRSDGPAQAAA